MSRTPPQPPQPPSTKSPWRFYTYQLVGMGCIFLFLALALFGLFDATQEKAHADTAQASLEVTYPTRLRYKTIDPFEIKVRNTSDAARSFTVQVDGKYLSNFSNVMFTPQPEEIQNSVYVFTLSDLPPGETVTISGELQSENYGTFEGFVRVVAEGDELEVPVRTVNLP